MFVASRKIQGMVRYLAVVKTNFLKDDWDVRVVVHLQRWKLWALHHLPHSTRNPTFQFIQCVIIFRKVLVIEQNKENSLCPFSISCQKELSGDIMSILTPNNMKHTKKSTMPQHSHAVPQARFQAVSVRKRFHSPDVPGEACNLDTARVLRFVQYLCSHAWKMHSTGLTQREVA